MCPVIKDQEILDNIGKLQAKLYMNKQNFNIEENIRKAEEFEKDKAWRFLWNDYRGKYIPDTELMKTAVEVLSKDEIFLEDLMDWIIESKPEVDTNSWENVLNRYEKEAE